MNELEEMHRAWSKWRRIGGSTIWYPKAISSPDGHVTLFVHGVDNYLWTSSRALGDPKWRKFLNLGQPLLDVPFPVRHEDGRIDTVLRGSAGDLRVITRDNVSGTFTTQHKLGGKVVGPPVAAIDQRGCMEIFVRGLDDSIWHNRQKTPGNWSGWTRLGGTTTTTPLAASLDSLGDMHVLHKGLDNSIWDRVRSDLSGHWGPFRKVANNAAGTPVSSVTQDGRLCVFFRGSDNACWHTSQNERGEWHAAKRIESQTVDNPVVIVARDGMAHIFLLGVNGRLRHSAQLPEGGFSNPVSLPGRVASIPAPVLNSEGRVELFARGGDGAVWTISQNLDL
ncbi:hypothetical protein ACFWIB_42350 [Streptomyces sp. NPDC127051]|uniref:hypothetical protein n=1 Tax=Streptomyces sp. NPDC127051 TaxID=3347119 RepID=UPI003654819F